MRGVLCVRVLRSALRVNCPTTHFSHRAALAHHDVERGHVCKAHLTSTSLDSKVSFTFTIERIGHDG